MKALTAPSSTSKQSSITKLLMHPDMLMGIGVVGILLALFLPIPTMLLDFLLALSIASSLVILLVGVYINKPLEFSVFPTVLLLSTIFRLGLNVATSRNVLIYGGMGDGHVSGLIAAFGKVIIGDNFIVGIVLFTILMVINFVVVTKGAGRIAEVAARFTLDAMPGKQMAVDAELNAGHITADEARKRRRAVEKEADFYGAMDGASKFVRGEAIAGIMITLVNMIIGFIVGVVQHNMSAGAAAQTFTLLSVGDGLISAIPSLMISIGAGMIVTRSTSEGNLSEEFVSQFRVHPKAFYIAGGLIFFMMLIPGFPKIAFLALTIAMIYLGRMAEKRIEKELEQQSKEKLDQRKTKEDKEQDNLDTIMKLDILAVEVGHGIVGLIDPSQDGEVIDRIQSLRKQFATELGIIVPQIQLRDNLQLDPGQYNILLKGHSIASGHLMQEYFLAMDPGGVEEPVRGESAKDPVYGLPALWVHKRDKDDAVFKGYTVVNCATVIATHITKVVRQYSAELLTRQDVQYLVDRLKETNPKVVEEVLHPDRLNIGDVVKVMQNLLREDVSVRDFLSLFECLADHCRMVKNTDILSEQCRKNMGRGIAHKFMNQAEGELICITLDRSIEDKLMGGLTVTENGNSFLDIDARIAQEILQRVMKGVGHFERESTPPCLMISSRLRLPFFKLSQPYMPDLSIVAYDEVPSGVRVKNLAVVN
jgi:flagellar biosynthesis protein FlhA